jgi:hypothetical protein
MVSARTNQNRSGKTKSSRHHNGLQADAALDHAVKLIDTVCRLAGDEHLVGNQSSLEIKRLRHAIAEHDTGYLFEQLMEAFSLQGISDHAAYTYMERNGRLTWRDLERATARVPVCSKLRSYWTFESCGYRKEAGTCGKPETLSECPLPKHDLRNGRLNQTAYALFLFIRDIAEGDVVRWIDDRLEAACEGSVRGRSLRMRNALVEPMRNLFGVSDKVLNMTLASLLTAAPTNKPLWLEAGVGMIAVDTLVHNFLHRTGILRRFNAEHPYSPSCYEPNGCAELVARIAERIDARAINPEYPKFFPRFVQHSIWRYCAQSEMNLCNAIKIASSSRCENMGCPLFIRCDRDALQPMSATTP